MQPKVSKAFPSARNRGHAYNWWVGRDATDPKLHQQVFGTYCEPVRMTGLADHAAVEAPAQRGEERADRSGVERETRRELKQQRAELAAEPCRLPEKCIERRVGAHQAKGVRDVLWRLDRKGEAARHCARPALVCRSPVWPVEGRVDLDCREALCVAIEMAARSRKRRRVLLGDRPPGTTDA